MNIDGHDIRPHTIAAVTRIEVDLEGAYEGTDQIARGDFAIVLVGGHRINIWRTLRCDSDKTERAVSTVKRDLKKLRDAAVEAISPLPRSSTGPR
jgi:hypothetical protein